MKLSQFKYKTKLFIGIFAISIVLVATLSTISVYQSKKGLYGLGETAIKSLLQAMHNSLLVQNDSIKKSLKLDSNIFLREINALGNINVSSDYSQQLDVNMLDQNSLQTISKKIYPLKAGEVTLNGNDDFLNKVQELVGGSVTIFQIVEGNLLRIATSVKKIDGERATGTYIPASSPVSQAIVRGEIYEGKAYVLDDWYLATYIPLRDKDQKVVAAIFVGRPILSMQMKEYLAKTKIGKGYPFVYDDDGLIVVHPTLEGKNIFGIVPSFKGHKEGYLEYSWEGGLKATYISYIEPWGYHLAIGMNKVDIVDGIDFKIFKSNVIAGLIMIFLATCMIFVVLRSIDKPLMALAEKIKKIGEGDYRVDLPMINTDDAIGHINNSVRAMVESSKRMLLDIIESSQTVASSATELSTISVQMENSADITKKVSGEVASQFRQMSDNINTIAAAVEQSAANLNLIAAAATEMGTTTEEIARNGASAHDITQEAVNQARQSYDNVQELGMAVEKIEGIVDVITEISEQTNLLALNATIEAARAGNAGKGFAVVANEIKELAKQTASATREIKNSIEKVQGGTEATVQNIKRVEKVIQNVNEMVATIATAVEEQSVTTREVVENVNQASSGISEISERVADNSQRMDDTVAGIDNVEMQTNEVSSGSKSVTVAAKDLSQMAEKLSAIVQRFKI